MKVSLRALGLLDFALEIVESEVDFLVGDRLRTEEAEPRALESLLSKELSVPDRLKEKLLVVSDIFALAEFCIDVMVGFVTAEASFLLEYWSQEMMCFAIK